MNVLKQYKKVFKNIYEVVVGKTDVLQFELLLLVTPARPKAVAVTDKINSQFSASLNI